MSSLIATTVISVKSAEPLGKQLAAIAVLAVLFIIAIVRQQQAEIYLPGNGRQITATHGKSAVVRLRLEPGGILRFDVDLGPIPMDTEVTANFIAPEIDNKNTFYTDENGMDM